MKIVMSILRFKPASGGGEEHVYQLSRKLIEMGHEVTIYTSDLKTHYPKLTYLEKSVLDEEEFDSVPVKRFHARPSKYYPVLDGYVQELMQDNCDLIHVHGYGYFTSDAAALVSLLRRRALILTTHGFFPATTQTNTLLTNVYVACSRSWLLKIAKKIISVSQEDAGYYRSLASPGKILVIPNGVDLDFWSEPSKYNQDESKESDAPIISAVGRLTFAKGFQSLIRAAPGILRRFPQAKIMIAGEDFGYLSQLKESARYLGVDHSIDFRGFLLPQQLKELYLESDVVVIPSLLEPFGMVALEAMACGKPVVASDSGALPEVIKHRVNGLLFRSGDHEALAEAVTTLIQEQDLAHDISRNNRTRVREYSWDSIAKRVERIYSEASDALRE